MQSKETSHIVLSINIIKKIYISKAKQTTKHMNFIKYYIYKTQTMIELEKNNFKQQIIVFQFVKTKLKTKYSYIV